MLTLYHNEMSVCAQAVRLALAEKGIEYKAIHLNLRAGDLHEWAKGAPATVLFASLAVLAAACRYERRLARRAFALSMASLYR